MEWNAFKSCCPSRSVLQHIADKWTVLIICALTERTLRFGELRREVDGISQKMLTQVLRGLERDGLVARTVYATVPPRVDYSLTELGCGLVEILKPIHGWLDCNMHAVLTARAAFDERKTSAEADTRPDGELQ